MNKLYTISVIIPCYNSEDTVYNTMSSVKNSIPESMFKKVEVIMINDGSTDNTLHKIYNFCWENKVGNVQVIDSENNGVSASRNIGLKKSQGKYVAFLDSDDIWLPNMFLLLSKLSTIDADIVEFNAVRVYNGVNEKQSNSLYPYITKTGFIRKEEIFAYKKECCNTFFFPSWGRFYKKDRLSGKKFPLLSTFEDILFVADVFLDAQSIFVFAENCVGYRDNPLSLTNNRSLNDVVNIAFVMRKIFNDLKFENSEVCFKLFFNTYLLLVDNLAHQKRLDKLNDFLFYREKIYSSLFLKEEKLKKKLKFYFPRLYSILYLHGKEFVKKNFPNIFIKLKKVIL